MADKQKSPIDKEYLISSFKDFDSKILGKKYIKSNDEQLHTHDNKNVLDKLDISDTGTLLFNGNEINNENNASDGKSAYEIAQDNGFEGTESEWLESLKGKDGTSIDAYTKKESDKKFLTAPQIWTGSNQFKFGVDADGNYGYYKAGADTVTPFLSKADNTTLYTKTKKKTADIRTGTMPTVSIGGSIDFEKTGGKCVISFMIMQGLTTSITNAQLSTFNYNISYPTLNVDVDWSIFIPLSYGNNIKYLEYSNGIQTITDALNTDYTFTVSRNNTIYNTSYYSSTEVFIKIVSDTPFTLT